METKNKSIKDILQARIKGSLDDLKEFHQDTFDEIEGENLTGEDIYRQTSDMEMDREEDAFYLMGKIEAYKDILFELNKENESNN